MIAEIFVDLPSRIPSRSYDYEVPAHIADLIEIGSVVIVPFSGQKKLGVVAGIKASSNLENLLQVEDTAGIEIVSDETMRLCKWTADRYFANFYRVLRLALPPGGLPKIAKKWLVQDPSQLDEFISKAGFASPISFSKESSLSASQLKLMGVFESLPLLIKRGVLKRQFEIKPPKVHEKIVRYYQLAVDSVEAFKRVRKGAKKQEMVIGALAGAQGPLPAHHLLNFSSPQTIRSLVKKGVISALGIESKRVPREHGISLPIDPVANEEQIRALKTIGKKLGTRDEGRGMRKILIQGVTGSGKTKIYSEAVAQALEWGRSSIVVVPEISLTPQILSRFKARFGGNVAILHSGLGLGERFDEWKKIHNGCQIVVGTRSAIFAPIKNLGLIIIDEEHDGSYKQDSEPKYHLHKVAEQRARLNDALLILGSATPLIETRYEADRGKSHIISLHERIGKKPLPSMKMIDMRNKPNEEMLISNELLKEMERSLNRGQKILVFLNRRGFSRYLLCPVCGWTARCRDCDVSLVYHKKDEALKCHQCGYTEEEAVFCPRCESEPRIYGFGIQRAEEEIDKLFPGVPIIRIDTDSTRHKGAHLELLEQFQKHPVAILLGTQMISKGLDFPEIGLVGVLNADSSINLPDFRAAERTFQQLVQVSGRAGRGNIPGKVIIQTFSPENDVIASAQVGYDYFYRKELSNRKKLKYPPFSDLVNILISGSSLQKVETKSFELFDTLQRTLSKSAILLGPAPAAISKLKGHYRWHILLKTDDLESIHTPLGELVEDFRRSSGSSKVRIGLDVDPFSMM